VYYIDPKPATIYDLPNPLEIIALSATEGMKKFSELLIIMNDNL
jgi:NAD-dependent deacetylase